jgi:prepilin peptidase CpaA
MNNELQALGELLWMLVTNPGTGMLIALLLVAAAIDWRTHRIPNWLTVAGMFYGLLYGATHATSVGAGLVHAASGLALGLVLLLPLWVLRIMGAGDVKLMAMVGAFLGAGAVFTATLWVLLAGGVLALWVSISHGKLRQLAANLRFIAFSLLMPAGAAGRTASAAAVPSVGKLPYGLAICIGSIAFVLARQLGYA